MAGDVLLLGTFMTASIVFPFSVLGLSVSSVRGFLLLGPAAPLGPAYTSIPALALTRHAGRVLSCLESVHTAPG